MSAAVIAAAAMALPASAAAAPVLLGTATPFAVLGAATVTNTGPSVINGDLGVWPGSALTGFTAPAVVNGATHANDAVAAQAQSDLGTAYNVAAAEPTTATLTGQDLGGKTLTPGTYSYSTSAQLTGALTLDAQGDPAAQFVIQVGSALTTASASSVVLINGASPCNVYWQVATSATLGSATAFQGTLMARASITANFAARVRGRLLARTGQVSLDNNVIDASNCAATPTPTGTPPQNGQPTPSGTASDQPSTPTQPSGGGGGGTGGGGSGGGGGGTGGGTGGGGGGTGGGTGGTGTGGGTGGTAGGADTPRGFSTLRRWRNQTCQDGFTATVRGTQIRSVSFLLDGRLIARKTVAPFNVTMAAAPGRHVVTARIAYADSTGAQRRTLRYRACAAALLKPRFGPSQFTG